MSAIADHATPHPVASGPATRLRLEDRADGSAGLTVEQGLLLRRGVPHQVLAGSLHYFRVHPALWYDRLLRLVDLGLNTVDTVVPWNFHQPTEGRGPDFEDWRNIGRFLETAASLGLDVLLRPGPYVCAEWTNGGLPSWLTARTPHLRSSHPDFCEPVARWFDVLLPRIAPYQAAHGGPIVAVQVENEFGSFGDDAVYLQWMVELLRSRGITELLYTSDGPTDLMLDGGSIDEVFLALNLGSRPREARRLLEVRRPGQPFFCAEFWNGWFDHWGDQHHVRSADSAATSLREIVADRGSVSLYMAHGGTNFGLWSGANEVDGSLRATVTSYDSDAPVAEDGTLTEKFFVIRELLTGQGPEVATRSTPPRLLEPRTLAVVAGAGLDEALDLIARPARADGPGAPTFEDLGLDGGMVRYRAEVTMPPGDVELTFERVSDRALIDLDGDRLGTVTASGVVALQGTGGRSLLTVVVENLGRVNYGPHLGQAKGLTGAVLVDRRLVQRWRADTLDIDGVDVDQLMTLARPSANADGPGVASARFDLEEPCDTHLALPGFGHGFVWVNGFLLGRHRDGGPQRTLYIPAPLLQTGSNAVVVLDLERRGSALELRSTPELGPPEQYVETF